MLRVARVVPDVTGVDKSFDYLVPSSLTAQVEIGARVRVPLHGRNVAGWVVAIGQPTPGLEVKKIREIIKVLGFGATQEIVDLAEWATTRWSGRMRSLIATATPKTLITNIPPSRYTAREVRFASPAVDELNMHGGGLIQVAPLTNLATIVGAVASDGPTLVVLPTQNRVKILASALKANKFSVAQWPQDWAMARAGVDIVVGTRSAVWAPMHRVASLIVVDEHDDLLQEERSPTWHARDVAIERARRAAAKCVLLSPIPSLAAREWAGRRVVVDAQNPWPQISIVDRNRDEKWGRSLVSTELIEELRDKSRRVVCVYNSKGRARLIACGSCRAILRCETCDAALVQPDASRLDCPRCGATRPVICQQCGSSKAASLKPGVSRLREELEASAGRSVVEVTAGSESFNHRATVFIGTEAVLHRLPSADTVVFLDIDAELLAPRYRANEIVATLIVHAARLVGRSENQPRIIIQTHSPDNELMVALTSGDFSEYQAKDRSRREMLGFPPFGSIVQISGTGTRTFIETIDHGLRLGGTVQTIIHENDSGLVRAQSWQELSRIFAETPRPPRSRLVFHVDPPRV